MKLDKRFNKSRPSDRTQADPRVVIGIRALATGYTPAEGRPACANSETTETWRGIRGGVPL